MKNSKDNYFFNSDDEFISCGDKVSKTSSLVNPKTQSHKRHVTTILLFAVLTATLGGSFQFGYNIGCVNAPQNVIVNFFENSYKYIFDEQLPKKSAKFLWELSVGIFSFGGLIGGVFSGFIANKIGRKRALIANNCLALFGALFMSFANFFNLFFFMTIGRFIIGINSGLNSGLVPLYIMEITPLSMRGSFGSICQLQITIAILFSQVLGLPQLLNNEENWPYIFGFTFVPFFVMAIFMPFCPESPYYNLIIKNDRDQAEKVLKQLRDNKNVSNELEMIDDEASIARNQPAVTIMHMFTTNLRWPLIIASVLMIAQQFSGINAVMLYSTEIFIGAGLKDNYPYYGTVAVGVVNVLLTVVSVWLVDHPKCGRRLLLLIGLIGMFFSSILISFVLTLEKNEGYDWASYSAMFFVFLYVISFAIGPGSIPWFYVNEIFPLNARGHANSIAVFANWTANFIIVIFFPSINRQLQQYTFLLFAGLILIFIIFTFKYVPETKNKSIEEINRKLYKKKKSSQSSNTA